MPALEISSNLLDKIVALAEDQQQSVEDFLTSLVDEFPSHSEVKYRHLVDKSLQGILIFQEGRIVFANETAVIIYGYTPKELMALSPQGVINLVYPDDQALVAADIQRFWQGVQTESHFEFRIMRADGQIRIVEIFASLMTWQGKPAIQGAFVDRTEQRQAEQELQESIKRYQLISDLMCDYAAAYHFTSSEKVEAQLEWVIGAFEEITGLTTAEALSNFNLSTPVHPDDLPIFQERQQKLRAGQADVSEFRVMSQDGSVRWLLSRGIPEWDEDHERLRVYVGVQDITERKQAEEAYHALVENSLQGFLIFQDNRVVFASSSVSQVLGYTPDELYALTDPITSNIHPSHQKSTWATVTKLLAGQPSSDTELRIITPEGENRWLHSMSSHVTYQGKPAIQVAILDITKRKEVELALQKSESRLYLFAETVDEVFWMLSANESELLFVNPAYETLTGLSYQSAYEDPRAWMQLIHPEDQQRILDEQTQSGAGVSIEYRDQEFRLVHPDGRLKWIWLRSWPIFNAQGEIVARASVAVDISQRKEMEETLSYAAAIIRSSDDAIIGKDLMGTIVSWNPGAERIYGYSVGEVIGQNISLLVPPDRPDEVPAILEHIKQGESVDHYETVRRRKDGRLINISLTISPIKDEKGTVTGASVIARDITAHKQAEEALRQSETRFRNLAEQSPDLIIILDVENRHIIYANRFEFLGYTHDELTGVNSILDAIHPDDREAVITNWQELSQGQSNSIEYRLHHKMGYWEWVQNRTAVLHRNSLGHPVQIMIIFTLITNRKQAEVQLQQQAEALRQSETRYRLVSELTSDYAYAIRVHADNSLTIEWMTEAFTRITGHSVEKVSENGGATIIYADDLSRYQQMMQNLFSGRPGQVELRIVTAAGGLRWVRMHNQPARDEAGRITYIYGAAQDITKQKEIEAAMLQAQKLESLGVLAGSVAHDFNNLLTAMLTHGSIARVKLGENNPADNNLNTIITTAERGADITRQLLAYSGKGRFVVTQLNLNDLISEHMKLLQATLPKTLTLTFQPTSDMVVIEGDSGQIQQVIMNLIINAADAYAGRVGKVEIMTAVHTITNDTVAQWQDIGQTVQPGRYVCLSVEDEGQGMDEFTLARIFDPFFTTKTTGRGLGLAAVQGIIRGHQGAIHIHSELGKGTRFDVLFPISQNGVAVVGGEKTAVTPLPGNLILIVDDEKVIRNAISEVLQLKGYRILEADNGHLAISLYQKHAQEISLILLDMTMPVLSGRETLQALCQHQLQAPVILMSGYDEQEIDSQTRQEVVVGFLKKPFRITTLMETISTVLSAKPTNDISA